MTRKTVVGTIEKFVNRSMSQYILTLPYQPHHKPRTLTLDTLFSEFEGKTVQITIQEADITYYI